MKIFLIRHGETTGDIEDRFGGDYDDHLTEKGRAQSQELAKGLPEADIRMMKYSRHFPMLDEPERFYQTLVEFLDRSFD
jgi:broad specificity phosphatase PhoE